MRNIVLLIIILKIDKIYPLITKSDNNKMEVNQGKDPHIIKNRTGPFGEKTVISSKTYI
jgi:hypothetical protein